MYNKREIGTVYVPITTLFFPKLTNTEMMNTYNNNDLLRYIYNEMPEAEVKKITEAAKNDWKIREALIELQSAKANLGSLPMHSPSKKSVSKIMQYAEEALQEITT